MTARFGAGFGETVTVTPDAGSVVSGEFDGNGDPVYTAGTGYDIDNVAVGVTSSAEDGGQMIITTADLYLPPGSVLAPTSRVTIRGVAGYQMEGDIASVVHPYSGTVKGVVAKVRRGS